MQNPTVIRARSKTAAVPARELPWTFLFLVVVCACVVAAGFFFAARQHFTAMDYSIKNSNLREQLQNLETEKRRLLLAREVALSPLSIRKAAATIGLREKTEMAAVQIAARKQDSTPNAQVVQTAKTVAAKSTESPAVVRTVLAAPVQSNSTGETRSRVVESTKEKKEKTEVAALLKLR